MGARGALVAATLLIAGCGGDEPQPLPAAPDTIQFSTPDFKNGAPIPRADTCDGAGKAPALAWRELPPRTVELVLIVDDPDASFTHWTAYGIAPTSAGLPAGTKEGKNSAGDEGWTPPCPPEGDDAHHYVFALYALTKPSGLEPGADPETVRAAVRGAAGRGMFTGLYKRG